MRTLRAGPKKPRKARNANRLGWVQYDLALLAEDRIYILREGWKFVGARRDAPLCQVVAEGWIPRPI